MPDYSSFGPPPGLFIIPFILFGALVIVVIIFAIRNAEKRVKEMFALAVKLNLTFSQRDPFNVPSSYSACDWFSQGHDREAYNVIHGQLGDYQVKAFDYTYETDSTSGTGSDRSTSHDKYHFSCVILDTNAVYQSLLVRPEGFFDRVGGAFGIEDIDFESDEFSRKFYVKSSDKKFAYDVIHARTMEFLLANPGWSLQLMGCSLIVVAGSFSLFKPEKFEQALTFAQEFLGLFPDYLKRELQNSKGGL